MALKLKMSNFGIVDSLKFAFAPKTREKIIAKTPAKEIVSDFKINQMAKALHPDSQRMIIEKIIDHEGAEAKTYILKEFTSHPVAWFRAGQYLSVFTKIGDSAVTRPYSISSSPKWAEQGKYAITVRKNKDGFVADYILDNWREGNLVTVSDPQGNFFYEELRDAENVVALAGGSGITPFLSMAYAIRDGIEDFNLTIIFGSRDEKSILFKEELDAICSECDKVKVIYVLSDIKRKKAGFEKGFITADLIGQYAPDGKYSLFICGPEAMYSFLDGELEKLGLEKKYVRKELLGVTKNVSEKEDYPVECKGKTFKLTVVRGEERYEIKASAEETVLTAIERAGINAPSRCRSGECGWCRSKLLSGKVYAPKENDGRRWADKENDYIHPCASFPVSDIVLEVPGSYME